MRRLHWIAGIFVVLLVVLAGAPNVNASPEKPKLAVVPFTGPQAKKAEAVVVRALRKKARIVPQTVWVKAAKKLFAKSHSSEDLAAVADDVGAQVVITGLVHRDGKAWQLSVSVRDGKTGKVHDRLRYPLKVPRLTGATLSQLAKEVTDAFEATLGGGPSPETTEAPVETKITPPSATTTAPPPPVTTTEVEPPPPPPRNPRSSRNPPSRPAPIATTIEPPPPPVTESRSAPPSDKRPSWAPYFDIAAGLSISGRSFSFNPASQPKFTSGIVAGIHADATVYPFAWLWRGGGRVVSGLGVGATIDKPFWPDSTSKQDPTQKFGTSELRAEGGIRWRIVLSKALPRPQLLLQAQYGMHQFTLQKDPLMGDVGPPDVSYQYATFGLGIRVHFAEWMYLWAMFNYHYVLSSGAITNTGSEYGPASNFGVRISGGLDFFVYKGLQIGVGGLYERFGLTFHAPAADKPQPAKTATSAVDQYFGGVITVGYVL